MPPSAKPVPPRPSACRGWWPGNKVEAIQTLGAEIRIVGNSQDDAQDEVDRLVAEQGLAMVPPFDNADIVAGQGTIGLELVEDLPDVRTVLVPLSGGGLLSGIALALKSVNPAIQVIGVTMERGPAMAESLRAGLPVAVEEVATLADFPGGRHRPVEPLHLPHGPRSGR